jgi:hypothetical protein
MSEPVPIDGARLFEFIGGAETAVVLVSVHPWQAFNRALQQELQAELPDVALGTVDITDLVIRGGPALRFLHQGLHRCGAPTAFGVLPGYCLFRGGRMLAWDAGLPDFADVAANARSAVLGALWSSVTHDASFVGHALHMAAEQVAAQHTAARFRRAIAEENEPRNAGGRDPSPPRDDVYWAYQVLGVSPSATDREVHDAWRRRQKENHPDHAAQDPVEFERRTRVSAEINRARDIILEFRAGGPRPAAWDS